MHERDDEQKSSLRVGTSDLLDMFTEQEPGVDFTIALGADTFIDLASGKWRRTEDVFRMVGYRMVVFRRLSEDGCSGESTEKDQLLQESVAKWQLINSTESSIRLINIPTLSNVSSSAVRKSSDETVMKQMLTSEVLDYIRQHKMYALAESEVE